MSRSASVWNAVAEFAPARQTGYVGSLLILPPSPNILRPLTDGALYFMDNALPPIVTEVWAGGLGWPFAVNIAAVISASDIKTDLIIGSSPLDTLKFVTLSRVSLQPGHHLAAFHHAANLVDRDLDIGQRIEIGRASCRERV